jgi:hypothetical protein
MKATVYTGLPVPPHQTTFAIDYDYTHPGTAEGAAFDTRSGNTGDPREEPYGWFIVTTFFTLIATGIWLAIPLWRNRRGKRDRHDRQKHGRDITQDA